MFIEGEDGAEDEYLWLFKKEKLFDRILDDLPNLLMSIAGLALGETENFGKALGEGAYALAEKVRCNPDGSSVYPVTHYANDPAESNAENLKKVVDIDAERKTFFFETFVDYAVENGSPPDPILKNITYPMSKGSLFLFGGGNLVERVLELFTLVFS